MEIETPVRTLDQISDDELEDCLDGSSNLELVRRLLDENTDPNGWIWDMDFGEAFAEAIEGFIDADPDTDEWDEAWENNREWGENIASNVNDALAIEEPEEYQ